MDRIELGMLFDFYGPMLTGRQRTLMALYCDEDFSFSEIAAREGITRQGVYDAIHRAERQLGDLEDQLGLVGRYRVLTDGLREGIRVLEGAPGEQAQQAQAILKKLLEQEEE